MTRQQILEAAAQCVLKDRQNTHGSPENSFSTIAAFWQIYLDSIGVFKSLQPEGGSRYLEPADVAVMMALLKIARIAQNPQHVDSWTDLVGYGACGGELATES